MPRIRHERDADRAPVREALHPYERLLDEVSRAEVRASGLLMDFGSADQHKYTRGGWRTGWGRLREMPTGAVHPTDRLMGMPARWAEMSARSAWLDLPALVRHPGPIALLRGRSSVPDQTLTLHVGAREAGRLRLDSRWGVARADLPPDALSTGPFRLELRAGRPATSGPHAEIDWFWIGTDLSAISETRGPEVGVRSIAGILRRAMSTRRPLTYSFYVMPPARSSFIVDLGSPGRATFTVSATTDDVGTVELFRESVAGAWRERAVSLERFAGKPVRLDLATSDQEAEASWGEPAIAVTEESQTLAASNGGPRNSVFLGPHLDLPGSPIIESDDGSRTIRVGSFKWTVTPDGMAMYDLDIDPGERYDLSTTRPIARRLCEVLLGEALANRRKSARANGTSDRAPLKGPSVAIDPVTLLELEALGDSQPGR